MRKRAGKVEACNRQSGSPQSLRLVLKEMQHGKTKKLLPLVTDGGSGLTDEFKDWNWDRIQDEIYRGRGT